MDYKNIKLICIDMDGTLLNTNREISPNNKNVIIDASKKGIHIVLTTGRLFASAKYYSSLIGLNGYIISCNGAFIKKNYTDSPLLEVPIPRNIILDVVSILKNYKLKIYFNSWDTAFRDSPLPKNHIYFKMNQLLDNSKKINILINDDVTALLNVYSGNILKIVVNTIGNDTRDLLLAKSELKNTFHGKLNIVSPDNSMVEIMLGTVSKGNAVSYLAKTLGISSDEIMCIGDGENDISMIKYAKLGIAMENAMDVLKKEANYITKSNDEDGVAYAIRKFIL